MKHVATALMIVGCLACLSYCQIQSDKNQHEFVMWCLKNGGQISNWSNRCIPVEPVSKSNVDQPGDVK